MIKIKELDNNALFRLLDDAVEEIYTRYGRTEVVNTLRHRLVRYEKAPSLQNIGLSVRAQSVLRSARITTIEQFLASSADQLSNTRNCGKKTLAELIDKRDCWAARIKEEPSGGEKIELEDLDLSVRAYMVLKRAGLNTTLKIMQTSPEQLKNLRNVGRRTVDEIIDKLESLGLNYREKWGINNDRHE